MSRKEVKHTLPDMVPVDGLHLEYFHDVQSNGRGFEIIFESVRDVDTNKTVCRLTGHVDTNVAKLFAAAPDMLAALKACKKELRAETPHIRFIVSRINDALAKAEGRDE